MYGPGTEGTADSGSAAGIFWQTGFGGHQGQVGHGGSQVQLEPGFDAAEVAGTGGFPAGPAAPARKRSNGHLTQHQFLPTIGIHLNLGLRLTRHEGHRS